MSKARDDNVRGEWGDAKDKDEENEMYRRIHMHVLGELHMKLADMIGIGTANDYRNYPFLGVRI